MSEDTPKIIVGIDYGTTYSGISYVTSNAKSTDQIEIINSWPGSDEVPTRISYSAENPGHKSDKWGFTVSSSSISYSWTKLLLDGNTTLTEFDDPSLRDLFGQGMMRLPYHKTASQVCSDYMKALQEHMVQTLCKKFGNRLYDTTPIDLFLTVPAIWSDAAKNATREAARLAGFANRSFDTVTIISEPEAAALAALKPHLEINSLDPLQTGELVLICDCGGGTVDITTYRILSTAPVLEFEELNGVIGTGGKCGSTYIDRNFNCWMTKTFGAAYASLPPKRRGPGSAFMKSFEAAKRAFGSASAGQDDVEIDHLNMNAPLGPNYDPDEATVSLTWSQMKSFFDPVINEIIRLVGSQVDAANDAGHAISRIILVGGFGNSDYLNERMSVWQLSYGAPPFVALRASVPKPASLVAITGILTPYSFALALTPSLIAMSTSSQVQRCVVVASAGRSTKIPAKQWHQGQVIDAKTETSFELGLTCGRNEIPRGVVTLFACSRDSPPDHRSNLAAEKIGEVHVCFSSRDFEFADKRFNVSMGEDIYSLQVSVKMNMNAEEGVLSFKTFAYGKPAGDTTINYEQIEAGIPVQRP
ncbi:hypothetical protein HDK90DRAFT_524724 [Phyllosticta capitalensis]|uniref:Actin-like ATPase domain-containing protein n=1 Tax=Phyllosticta capitalensis TaxID=121624 RepID=A0ABR1YP49_9PEZI